MIDPSEYPYSFQLYDVKMNKCATPGITSCAVVSAAPKQEISSLFTSYDDMDIASFFIGKDLIPKNPLPEEEIEKKKLLPIQRTPLPTIKTIFRLHVEGRNLYKALLIVVENFKKIPQDRNPLQTYVPIMTCKSMEEFLLSENADYEGYIFYRNKNHLVERLCFYIEWEELRYSSFFYAVHCDFVEFLEQQLATVLPLQKTLIPPMPPSTPEQLARF